MSDSRVLLCFAVPAEARPVWARKKEFPPHSVVVTGMGQDNAGRAIRKALAAGRPSAVVTTGFAGGLDPALESGLVVYEADDLPDLNLALARAGGRRARFHCAPRVAVTAEEKRSLREETRADAVEMESGVIARVCREASVPCATVRVILDTAGQDLPLDFNQVLAPDQSLDVLKLGLALLRRPGTLPRLLRFQRQVNQAATALAQTLVEALRSPGR